MQITPADWVLSDRDHTAFYNLLGADEKQRLERLRPRKQREFLLSRALLRHLLSHAVDQRLSPGEWCVEERVDLPPRVVQAEQADLYFSISHSGGVVAVAVSHHVTLGIDIEYRRPRDFLGLAQTAFHPLELESLARHSAEYLPRAFYRHWTLGEASLKLRLLGLGSGMAARLRIDGPALASNDMDQLAGLFTEYGDWSLALVSPQPIAVQLFEAIPGAGVQDVNVLDVNALDVVWERADVLMPCC